MSAQADSRQATETGEVSIVFVCTGNICRSAMAERIAAAEHGGLVAALPRRTRHLRSGVHLCPSARRRRT